MLTYYLNQSNDVLDSLVYTINLDIQDLSKKDKSNMFNTMDIKSDLLSQLNTSKLNIQNEISHLMDKDKNNKLENILDDEQKELLKLFEQKMRLLQEKNKSYAKLLTSVGRFYFDLFDVIVPHEMQGYLKVAKKSSFLNVTA
jgi:hypothetical protein